MEACIDADEKGEALKYIPKLADPREKAEVRSKIIMDIMHVLFPVEVLFIARFFLLCGFLDIFNICSVLCPNWHGKRSR